MSIYGESKEDRFYERMLDRHTDSLMDHRCVVCDKELKTEYEQQKHICEKCRQGGYDD